MSGQRAVRTVRIVPEVTPGGEAREAVDRKVQNALNRQIGAAGGAASSVSLAGLSGAILLAASHNVNLSLSGQTITLDGRLAPFVKMRQVSTPYTMLADDYILVFGGSAASLTFLPAASCPGKIVRVLGPFSYTLTTVAASGDTIQAWPNTKYTEWVSDGVSNWVVVLDK